MTRLPEHLLTQRLLALFAAGWLLLDFPLLRLWLSDATVFGLPLLPVALFGAWALLIALLARLMEAPGRGLTMATLAPAVATALSPTLVLGASLAYLLALFAVAWWADRRAAAGRSVIGNAWVYALSMGVYCTAWTYFGSVGRAASGGVWFLPIYLGPTLAMVLAWLVLRKMVRIARTWRITSIADFIASRYGKSRLLAGLVTLIALVGVVPYVALQLKAVASGFALLTGTPHAGRGRVRHRAADRAGAGRLHHRLRHAPPRQHRAPRGPGGGHRGRVGGQAAGLPGGRRLRHLGAVRRPGRPVRARHGRARDRARAAAGCRRAPSPTTSGSRSCCWPCSASSCCRGSSR